jgi:nitrogen regulatory protein PII
MKAIFVSYNQALTERINDLLDEHGVRGFTRWTPTEGRGSFTGEPHYGNHTWPAINTSVLAIVEDEKVAPVMEAIRRIDAEIEKQGCRAFVWNIEQAM